MLFRESDAPLFKQWIIKRLANTSDAENADADILADYVLALLRHDGDVAAIRQLFEENIPDFLSEDSATFTNDVFSAVELRSYLPGRPQPPAARLPTFNSNGKPSGPPLPPVDRGSLMPGLRSTVSHTMTPPEYVPSAPLPPRDGRRGPAHLPYVEASSAINSVGHRGTGRKRNYRDFEGQAPQPAGFAPYGAPQAPAAEYAQQLHKHPRTRGRFNGRAGRGENVSARASNGVGNGFGTPSAPPYAVAGALPYNSNFPYQAAPGAQEDLPTDLGTLMNNMRKLQDAAAQMGLDLPPMPELPQMPPIPQPGPDDLPRPVYSGSAMAVSTSPPRVGSRQPCRDFSIKGFCARGNRCSFEHPSTSGYIPPSGFTPAHAPSMPGFLAGQRPLDEEYDPNNATMAMPPQRPTVNSRPTLNSFEAVTSDSMPFHKPKEAEKSRIGQFRPRGLKGRSVLAYEGPVHDRTRTELVVENIPKEHYTEDEVRKFFSQFGVIEKVTFRPEHRWSAVVKFDNWDSATAAWRSPKVMFDNRFVKAFWYKEEPQVAVAGPGKASPAKSNVDVVAAAHQQGDLNPEDSAAKAEPEFDMEEFLRKQEQAQKTYEEKVKKRQALDSERELLEEKRRELATRRLEEKRKLEAKLVASRDKTTSMSPAGCENGQTSQAEALRAQLAALEAEANSLGLDPEAAYDDTTWESRGRGRGRRPYRARGAYVPRAHRGGYRGRGGGTNPEAIHAAYSRYSLDNRPKIIALKGVDFTDPAKDEALRQYALGIGELAAIHLDPTVTHVTFKDRKTAEKFSFGVSGSNSIPGVEGTVELSWATEVPKSQAAGRTGTDTVMASGLEEEFAVKTAMTTDAAAEAAGEPKAEHMTAEMNMTRSQGSQDGNMDYEGEDDWGQS